VSTRFDEAIAAIDAANADDPFTVTYVVDGVEVTRPKELAHSELRLEPIICGAGPIPEPNSPKVALVI
jgi:hypothetical protein